MFPVCLLLAFCSCPTPARSPPAFLPPRCMLGGWLAVLLGCWLASWLACWVAGWLARWLAGSLARWLAGSLACWLAGLLACWLAGLLACWLAGSLACWLAACLLAGWLAGLLACLLRTFFGAVCVCVLSVSTRAFIIIVVFISLIRAGSSLPLKSGHAGDWSGSAGLAWVRSD